MLARQDQEVDRGLGRDVRDGDALAVLVDSLGGDSSGNDVAEKASARGGLQWL
jgi:hypothetical protein